MNGEMHPIVAAMGPSAEQWPAVMATGCDVVVTAGAGTGKTLTLVARYLALLAGGCPLRAAIAITFTEKAAREMRNRVRDEVRRYLEDPTLDEIGRDRWAAIYSGLDAARISTIHGLCAEILHAHPAEARVDPRFGVLDEGQGNLLRRQAVDAALARASEEPDLVTLFTLLGERGLRDTLEVLLRARLDAGEVFARMHGDVMAQWRAALADRQAAALAGLRAAQDWQDAAALVLDCKASQADDLLEIQRQAAAAALVEASTACEICDCLSVLSRLNGIVLKGGRAAAWPGGKEQVAAVKAALMTLRDLWRADLILHLALTAQDELQAAAMPALQDCFRFACDRYAAMKRERNALDFDDLEAGALALLEANTAVRSRWQVETAALLVDEFQDTNDRQRRLVRCLNGDASKLFIVGDAKQSIYGFRGADVTVFRAERETIARGGGTVVSLDTSYRGHRGLVHGLNDLLRPVLGESADPARPWIEPFAALRHSREAAGPGFAPPFIEMLLALGPKSDGGLARAADALAARLAALVESGDVQVEEKGVRRALGYGDVAILCRASNSFADYENALERAGIPFLTVAGRGFYGRPEIRDLLNALAALADPADDLALAGLLRSPAFGISDAGLYRLVEAGRSTPTISGEEGEDALPEPKAPVSLWDTLRTVGPRLPGEDGPRAVRSAAILRDLHASAGRAPVADLLKSFLDATTYRAALIAAGQARAARNVSKLLADAHASAMVSVGEFLAYMNELRDSGAREGEARAAADGAVQIMSVHAAKGLEFPVVVIGDATYAPPARDRMLLDPALGVLLPQKGEDGVQSAIYRLGKLTASDRDSAESDRILYVAATRAREMLIVSGCITCNRDGIAAAPRGWLGRLSDPACLGLTGCEVAVDPADTQPCHLDLQAGATTVACHIYGQGWTWAPAAFPAAGLRETPQDVAMPLPPPLLAPVMPDVVRADRGTAEQERDPGQRVWRVVPATVRPDAPAWVIGKLVHVALALWRFGDEDGAFERWIEARGRSYGLADAHQLQDAVSRTRMLLRRFRAHDLHAEMSAAKRLLHEVPYSVLASDGRVENGIIDALYLRDDGSASGAWTIVEFKTDHVRGPADLERLLAEEDYLAQAERYASAVERLLDQRPALTLCLLDYAGSVLVLRPDLR